MYATPQMIGRAQLGLNGRWSWTWQRAQKAFDVRILEPGVVTAPDDDPTRRTVLVSADRLILGMNETGDKAREQKLTMVCMMKLDSGNGMARVDDIVQTPDGAPPKGP